MHDTAVLKCAAGLQWITGPVNDRCTLHAGVCVQEAEAMVGQLSEVAQHQKLRMQGLAQEKADLAARLTATNPQVRLTGAANGNA